MKGLVTKHPEHRLDFRARVLRRTLLPAQELEGLANKLGVVA
jgi:hypothetical protein